MKELLEIQKELKAPKGQFNKFGNFKYRSCEDILEAVKPLLAKNNCTLTMSDDIVMVGTRIYVKAIATLTNSSMDKKEAISFAREEESKKGMDGSQVTGAASSYARKYALNGLFCIDDNKYTDNPNKEKSDIYYMAVQEIRGATTEKELANIYNMNVGLQGDKDFVAELANRKNELRNA